MSGLGRSHVEVRLDSAHGMGDAVPKRVAIRGGRQGPGITDPLGEHGGQLVEASPGEAFHEGSP
jgi:hypothetical protein